MVTCGQSLFTLGIQEAKRDRNKVGPQSPLQEYSSSNLISSYKTSYSFSQSPVGPQAGDQACDNTVLLRGIDYPNSEISTGSLFPRASFLVVNCSLTVIETCPPSSFTDNIQSHENLLLILQWLLWSSHLYLGASRELKMPDIVFNVVLCSHSEPKAILWGLDTHTAITSNDSHIKNIGRPWLLTQAVWLQSLEHAMTTHWHHLFLYSTSILFQATSSTCSYIPNFSGICLIFMSQNESASKMIINVTISCPSLK